MISVFMKSERFSRAGRRYRPLGRSTLVSSMDTRGDFWREAKRARGRIRHNRGSELKTHPKARGGCDAGMSIDFESSRRGDPSNLQLDSLSLVEEGETTLKCPLAAHLRRRISFPRVYSLPLARFRARGFLESRAASLHEQVYRLLRIFIKLFSYIE